MPTVLMVLLLGLLAGHLCTIMEGNWWVPVPLLVAAGGTLLGALLLSPDAGHPRLTPPYYGLDADSGKAYWLSRGDRTDRWTARFMGAGATLQQAPAFFQHRGKVLAAPAPVVPLPAPAVEVVADRTDGAMRTVRLNVTAPGGAAAVSLHMMPNVDVVAGKVNGKPISYRCQDSRCIPWSITHVGLPPVGPRPPELVAGWGIGLTWPSDTSMVSKQFKL